MKRFTFRLARVQRLRAVEEELARECFGSAERRAGEAERSEHERRGGLEQACGLLRTEQSAVAVRPARVLLALDEQARQHGLHALAQGRAQALRLEAEQQRQAWIGRRQAMQALERLEQRARAAWRTASERTQAQELDESAGQRDARLKRLDHRSDR